jgi:hypothetical protein
MNRDIDEKTDGRKLLSKTSILESRKTRLRRGCYESSMPGSGRG